MELNQAVCFSALQPAAALCHSCILGSSQIKSLCPGGCAACVLPSTVGVPEDLLSLLAGLL